MATVAGGREMLRRRGGLCRGSLTALLGLAALCICCAACSEEEPGSQSSSWIRRHDRKDCDDDLSPCDEYYLSATKSAPSVSEAAANKFLPVSAQMRRRELGLDRIEEDKGMCRSAL